MTMMQADGSVASPIAAFVDWEERQAERWERVGGVVRMMSGGSLAHDRIGNNIRAILQQQLRGTRCSGHGPDLKVLTPRDDAMYPDAFVRCGKADPAAVAVDDPVVVFEVLSTGTAQHDLTRKRLAYKTIPSLKLIVYVAQDRARLDIVRRQPDGRWDDDEPVVQMAGELAMPEIGATLGMSEIYEGLELDGE
jgi:Uma2 family endonuclease